MVLMTDLPRRGDVWTARLDPTVGSEIKKTRPVVIISNDINNQFSPLVSVLPVSDKGTKTYPFEVPVSEGGSGVSKPSKIRCQQIRTIDKERLVKKLGMVDKSLVPKIKEALKLHLGMDAM